MALVRRAASSLFALVLLAAPALAGDRALLEVIGYSADGRYFAFEEFGISDGAGFPYSTIYVVDLAQDSWVEGTPIRAQSDSEDTPLAGVRDDAHDDAALSLQRFGIDVPAQVLALLGDGVPAETGRQLRFGVPGYQAGAVQSQNTLALETFASTSPLTCMEWFSTEPLGFALTLDGDEGARELHRDKALPRSRGCALDYRLYGVFTPFEAQDLAAGVAIVSVYPGGFEGPDRRFLAVPLGR